MTPEAFVEQAQCPIPQPASLPWSGAGNLRRQRSVARAFAAGLRTWYKWEDEKILFLLTDNLLIARLVKFKRSWDDQMARQYTKCHHSVITLTRVRWLL